MLPLLAAQRSPGSNLLEALRHGSAAGQAAGLTFTRASVAVAFPDGAPAFYAAQAPRFEGGYLLIEGARTNLIANARTIGGTGWTNTALTTTAITGPSGVASDATRINEGVTADIHSTASASATLSANASYVWSVLAKAGTGRYLQVVASTAHAGANVWANFDLLSGVLGSVGSSATANITQLANGWYRCEVRGVTVAGPTSAPIVVIGMVNSASATRQLSYAGTGLEIDVSWAGAEVGAGASSPVLPEVGTPLATARAAEFLTTTLQRQRLPASARGTYLLTGVMTTVGTAGFWQPVLQIDDGSPTNRIFLVNDSGSAQMRIAHLNGGSYTMSNMGVVTPNTHWRAGLTIDGTGRVAASLNGAAVVALTGAPVAGLTNIRLGRDTGTAALFGGIGLVRLLRSPVSDADLISIVAAL